MAKPPEKGAKKAAAAKSSGGGRSKLIAYILAPPVLFIAYPTVILALGGMLPTLVAYIIDQRGERYAARTVGYMNVSGVLVVAIEMWAGDHTWRKALDLLADPINWLIMFGTAALGWALYFALPPMVKAYLKVSNELRMKQFRKEQERLINEWGKSVARNAPARQTAKPKSSQEGVAASQAVAESAAPVDPETAEYEASLLALVDDTPANDDTQVETMDQIGEKVGN